MCDSILRRDAISLTRLAGVADDSRWTNDRGSGWTGSGLLPESPLGWVVTFMALAGIVALLLPQHSASTAGGQQLGSASGSAAAAGGPLPWGRQPTSAAAEASREAFLRRFDNAAEKPKHG